MVILCSGPYANEKENYGFPFPLSDFQKYAIQGIIDGHHVLITAHTGSGKTLPAEFAIDYMTGGKKRVIYTTPIKALSNQKYYEFTRKFPHLSVGLMTGDIKTNPDADVVIMTTEILLHQLQQHKQDYYPPFISDNSVGCVVFDEVHYINDVERGQVWEKAILSLPPHIQMVMLSATIDNVLGFASWCENRHTDMDMNTNKKQVVVATTNHRVVPLTHYGFQTTIETLFKKVKDKTTEKAVRDTTNTLILLQEAGGAFKEEGVRTLQRNTELHTKHQIHMKRKHVLNQLALFLREREMLPAIAFVFSRKNVEVCATEITVPLLEFDSKVAYTVARECEAVLRKLPNYREYLELPEYKSLVALLEKGIGIHHSGMIPILREMVELMISKKYIKLLFATESFAIGLDCPIKTAVFTGLTKFDGHQERFLYPHEYTQMAGRAGRRGIDTVGYVVHCNNLFPSSLSIVDYKKIMGGVPQKLTSKFRMTYSLVLGLLSSSFSSSSNEGKGGEGRTITIDTIIDYVEKSRMYNEIQEENASIQKEKQQFLTKKEEMERGSLLTMKTPRDICILYLDALEASKTQKETNKKRKERERDMTKWEEEWRTIKTDSMKVQEWRAIMDEIAYLERMERNNSEYIRIQIGEIVGILKEEGFLVFTNSDTNTNTNTNDTMTLHLTEIGRIASRIAEIHPLLSTKCWIEKGEWFSRFTAMDAIGLFSCFTDIKVPEGERRMAPPPDLLQQYPLLHTSLQKFQRQMNIMRLREEEKNIESGFRYDELLQYDAIEPVMEWATLETEEECRLFLQEKLGLLSISVGDFVKCLLKIVAITNEWIVICEEKGALDCKAMFSLIEGSLLKYIATNNSLYV